MDNRSEKFKTHHEAFRIEAQFEVWIEQDSDGFHVFSRLCTAGTMAGKHATHSSKIEAYAHVNAIKALFAPNIIEGSELNVMQLRKGTFIHEEEKREGTDFNGTR